MKNNISKTENKPLYFDSLIDDFGIWQHTDGKEILRSEGYALDDATRGLLFTLASGNMEQSEVLFSYILKSRIKNKIYGFSNSERVWLPAVASDDAMGQVVWSAGYALSKYFHGYEAKKIITDIAQMVDKMKHIRGYAYGLLGAIYVNKDLADYYLKKLKSFLNNMHDNWYWPEKTITYGNGIIPYALLRYALVYDDKSTMQLGHKILIFLEKCCNRDRIRGPIGNDGWLSFDSDTVPIFSQQPIDSAYMIWAWLAMYQLSGSLKDKKMCELWMNWFEGDNILREKMYDPRNMKCFDGIDYFGVHKNSGAESNICLLLSKHMLSKKITI